MRIAVMVVFAVAIAAVMAADTVDLGERDTHSGTKKWNKVLGKQPTLVVFYSPNCAHSRGFMPEFEAAASEFGSDVAFARVDITRWDELKAKYDVRRVPDIRFCSAGGRDDDCSPYPDQSPNTKAGVLEYLSGRVGSRFARSDTEHVSEAEAAAILATKGTCDVAHNTASEAEAADSDLFGADEEGDAEVAEAASVQAADETFDEESDVAADAFVELVDEAEAEVAAELANEDEAEDEEETEDEEQVEDEDEDEAEAEEEVEGEDEAEQEAEDVAEEEADVEDA